jgi:hypothetical protein
MHEGQADNLKEAFYTTDSSHYTTWEPITDEKYDDDDDPDFVPNDELDKDPVPVVPKDLPTEMPSHS